MKCERCGYGDGPYFTEIYDPLTGHQRTIYLCAHCQVTMYTMVLEYMREHEKVGGDVRENENQVDDRESYNRFGNHAKSRRGLPVARSNTTQLISYYIKEKGDAHYERIRERFKNERKAPAIQMPRVRGCPALLRRGDTVVRKVQTGMARLGGERMTAHLCPICDHPMDAEEIESPNVNPGGSTKVWHCNDPGCYDSLREQYHTFDDPDPEIANPYLLRYDRVKEPAKGGFVRIHIGSCSAPEVGRLHFCPYCDNEVEILDSVYWIWNCPNCLLIRSGGLIERYYPIEEDGTIDTDKEIRKERRGLPRWAPFAPLEDDEEEGEE